MTLAEIREECRSLARDVALIDTDRLWPDEDMNRYINRIYRQIARETKCIVDTETLSICQIAVAPVDYTTYVAGTRDYIWANDPNSWLYHEDVCPYLFDLDRRILQIDEVKWTYRQWKLVKVSVQKWQPNPWWEQVKGMPTEYATDVSNNKLALNFRDTETDYLSLQVRRMPLVDLVSDLDEPEWREHYTDFMYNGVLWQMYSKQDSDAINPAKAAEHRQLYLQDIDEIKQQETILNQRLSPNYAMAAFR